MVLVSISIAYSDNNQTETIITNYLIMEGVGHRTKISHKCATWCTLKLNRVGLTTSILIP